MYEDLILAQLHRHLVGGKRSTTRTTTTARSVAIVYTPCIADTTHLQNCLMAGATNSRYFNGSATSSSLKDLVTQSCASEETATETRSVPFFRMICAAFRPLDAPR